MEPIAAPPSPAPRRGLALLFTTITGASGLIAEVVWQRALSILLGSHGEATAAVLAIFLGSLAVGYAAFGSLCRRHPEWTARDLLLRYAAAEAVIGLHALAFPLLFGGVRAVSVALPFGGFSVDLVLCTLLLAPPAILMGATIPVLTEALSRDAADATRFHARVYGYNTLGACAGSLAAGFVLLPALGIDGSLRVAAGLNLAAALVFVVLARRAGTNVRRVRPGPEGPAALGVGPELAAALCLGFATMSLQTVVIRIAGLAFGANHATFAVVVATFVLCIALGSLAVARRSHFPASAPFFGAVGFAGLLALLHPWIEDASFVAHRIRVLLPDDALGFALFQFAMAGLLLLVLVVPLALSGALLPLLFHTLQGRLGELGGSAGRLYAWNTVGSVLGALVGGHALLHVVDLHHVHRIAIAAIAVAAALLVHNVERQRTRAWGAVFVLLVAAVALPGWAPERLSTAHLRLRQAVELTLPTSQALADYQHKGGVLFATDDPTTTVLVNEHATQNGSSRALFTNGKSDGSLWPDYPTMALTGLIPCVLAEQCRSAFVIGFGTGVTAGELAEIDDVERVVVAEISQGVIDAAPMFARGNRKVHTNPKVSLRRADAYRALLRSDERFDVIASEPSHPWALGVENLFSLDFLAAARDRLRPGGVYAQWMYAYEIDDATLHLVLRTFAAAFPSTAIWFAHGPDLLLLGFPSETPPLAISRLAERLEQPDFDAGLARAGIHTLPALLAHELIPPGLLPALIAPGPLHTLGHPRLGHAAARAFYRDARARLPRITTPETAELAHRHGALARLAAEGGLDEAAFEAVARAVCASREWECPTILAAWQASHPDSDRPETLRVSAEGTIEAHVLPERISLLTALYGDGLAGPLDAETVGRVIENHRAYTHHALPFRVEALAATVSGCEGEGCDALRRAFENGTGDPF